MEVPCPLIGLKYVISATIATPAIPATIVEGLKIMLFFSSLMTRGIANRIKPINKELIS